MRRHREGTTRVAAFCVLCTLIVWSTRGAGQQPSRPNPRAPSSDSSVQERLATLSGLYGMGSQAIPALIAATSDPDTEVVALAIRLLSLLAPTRSTVNALVRLLGSTHSSLRSDASDALGGFGPSVRPALEQVVKDSGPRFRSSARQALRYMDYAAALPYSDRCYKLTTGAWSPSLQLGADSVFIRPPTVIRMTTVKERGSLAKGDLVLRVDTAGGGTPYVGGSGYWIVARDSLRVWWSNGFSGLAVTFFKVGGALVGTAHTFWDFERVTQQAEMRLAPLSCD